MYSFNKNAYCSVFFVRLFVSMAKVQTSLEPAVEKEQLSHTKTILHVHTVFENDAHFQLLGITSPETVFSTKYVFVFTPLLEVLTNRANAHLADQLLSPPFWLFFFFFYSLGILSHPHPKGEKICYS